MADWEEIKRLAADFQRTQISDTLQRISERNCIDIIKKLTDLNLIELIYTCDGKEFITPAHLLKEIEDEIYVNGGRMHLHDLANNLNVDYQHVESRAKDLVKNKPDEYNLILGQVIHSNYKITLGKQISDYMLINGQLSIADFSKGLNLPSEFLLTIVKEILPKVVDDFVISQDERTYYTTELMDRYKAIIAGTLSAISKPTTIASLMKRVDLPERIFMPIVDGMIKDGRIDAAVENRLFIPAVYAREQNEWINKFYSSNYYIEYDVLSRMDIKQPKAFLKKRFPDGIQLKTCLISPELVSQVESLVEDSIASNGWIDISSIVPSAIESDDIEQLLNDIFKKNKQFNSSCLVFNQTNVCSLGYIATCKSSFEEIMLTKVQEQLKQGKLVAHFLGGKVKEPSRSEDKVDESRVVETKPSDENENSQKVESKGVQNVEEEIDPQQTDRGIKKDRKDRKAISEAVDLEESDEDLGGKKSKGRKSGAGAGSQGREVRQKAVKKKYIPGNKSNQKGNDLSDDEPTLSKTPRSNKGRAARRALSPARLDPIVKSRGRQSNPSTQPEIKPLLLMETDELIDKLRIGSRGDDCSEEFLESIARTIEEDLNVAYEKLAKQTLDDYLKAQADNENDQDTITDMVE